MLTALLRAKEIPAALCYQRLAVSDGSSYCLHGLNAVYLEGFNWYRIDAQGDNLDVAAEFRPPVEFLAFSLGMKGEADLPELWAEPLPIVTKVLDSAKTYLEVAENLPDLELASIK